VGCISGGATTSSRSRIASSSLRNDEAWIQKEETKGSPGAWIGGGRLVDPRTTLGTKQAGKGRFNTPRRGFWSSPGAESRNTISNQRKPGYRKAKLKTGDCRKNSAEISGLHRRNAKRASSQPPSRTGSNKTQEINHRIRADAAGEKI